MSEEEKDRSENATDPIEKAADKIWADEHISRDEVAAIIREAVRARTAELKAERDEWHAAALDYARSSDDAHAKLFEITKEF